MLSCGGEGGEGEVGGADGGGFGFSFPSSFLEKNRKFYVFK